MKLLLRTPTARFSHYGRNLVIEQDGQKVVIERADIPELLASASYVSHVEKVSREEIAECCSRLELLPPCMSPQTENPSEKIEKSG
jgi:hypothetical protein